MKFLIHFVFLASLLVLNSAQAGSLFFSTAAKIGLGNNSTQDNTTVPSTTLAAYSLDLNLAYNVYGLILGGNGEYAIRKQITDPSKVSNKNSQGKLLAISPVIGFQLGAFRVLGKIPSVIFGEYKLDQNSVYSQAIKYKAADIMSVQVHWLQSPLTFVGLEYQSLKFKKMLQNGNESTLADEKKLQMKTFSLLYGIYF
ncbi:MAG: hypothetical protein ACXVLQ_11895 [Bacteriovorax sp.]